MRALTLLSLLALAASSSAQTQTFRRRDNPMDAFSRALSPAKRKAKEALFARYPKDNARYTKGLLALLSPKERTGYVALVKAMQTDFMRSHPGTNPADIEIFGGYGIHAAKPKP